MASEIRVNTINNRSGLGTISITDSGASFSGVVTATSFSGDLTGNVTSSSTSTFSNGLNVTSGNVGIGTDNPTSKLQVYNASSTPVVKISGPTSGSSALEFYASTTKNGALLVNSSGFLIAADNSNPITFNAGGSERLRIDSSGNVQIANGNLVFSTSGTGIDFSATSDAGGMTSELLDDYEEGTWTPALTGDLGGSGQTYSQQNGFYTKVGRLVNVCCEINLTNKGTITRYPVITGMPFNRISNDAQRTTAVAYFANMATSVYNVFVQHEGNTRAYFFKVTGTATSLTLFDSGGGDIANNSRFILAWSYQASS